MKNYRRTLPPLDLLVFFEAVCRVGSFTGCAMELGVSQAAVSKRIRQLEEWIGCELFVRNGKRINPTAAAEKLFQTTGMALEFLEQGLGALRDTAEGPLSIGCNTGIGMFWLTPQLRSFGLSEHACPVRLVTSDNSSDLLQGGNDLVVIYGDGSLPGWKTKLLLHEQLTPVAAPAVAAALGAQPLSSILEIPPKERPALLNYKRFGPDWVDWTVWFKSLELPGFRDWRLKSFATYSQTIGEAIQGSGIALGSLSLLQAELEAGTLVRLGKDILRTGRGYYLCYEEKSALGEDAANLEHFLVRASLEFSGG